MPMLRNLETRVDVPEPLAAASSFVESRKIKRIVAAMLNVAVSPMAAIAVTVVTVVIVTVVTTCFSVYLGLNIAPV